MANIITSKGHVITVDDDDYELLNTFKWHIDADGYFQAHTPMVNGKRKHVKIHRFITNAPTGMVVDHINHDKSDNRKANLRVCTHTENVRNMQTRKQLNGIKGVYFTPNEKRKKKYLVCIRVDGRQKNIGRFLTQEEAANAYDIAAKLHYGEFACTNKENS